MRLVVDFSNAQHDIGHDWASGRRGNALEQGRFEKRQLLNPYRRIRDHVELLESNRLRPCVRGHVLANNRRPMPLQSMLQQSHTKPEALRDIVQNGSER